MACAAVLGAVAVWLVVATLRGAPFRVHGQGLPLSAGVRYTVKVGEVPQERREAAEAMLKHPVLVSLAGRHRLFLCKTHAGKVALCVGSFPAGDDAEALELLDRLKSFKRGGSRPFAAARIWAYTPAE